MKELWLWFPHRECDLDRVGHVSTLGDEFVFWRRILVPYTDTFGGEIQRLSFQGDAGTSEKAPRIGNNVGEGSLPSFGATEVGHLPGRLNGGEGKWEPRTCRKSSDVGNRSIWALLRNILDSDRDSESRNVLFSART